MRESEISLTLGTLPT